LTLPALGSSSSLQGLPKGALPEHFVWSSFIQELLTLPELEYSAIDSPQAAGMVTKKQWKLYLELRRLTWSNGG
jgi:hypothetical protein